MTASPLTALARIRIVLVESSHPGNVGAVARAMKTMGLAQLWLVKPEDPEVHRTAEAVARASGAADILASAQCVDALEQALSGVTFSCALTARGRELGPPAAHSRDTAQLAWDHACGQQGDLAFVFGSERTGLSNQDVLKCQRICHIPTSEEYSSLNLSQAVQIVTYELRSAALAQEGQAVQRPVEPAAASAEAVEALLTHWEQALVAIRFLDPLHPKRLMPRLRRLFARARLEREEVDLLRGVAKEMLGTAARAAAQQADKK